MKFNIDLDIDCTPEEARTFLGLPNIAPLQDRMLEEIEERMQENIRSLDPETFMKTWMPATIQGWTELQKMFWDQMGLNVSESQKSSASNKK